MSSWLLLAAIIIGPFAGGIGAIGVGWNAWWQVLIGAFVGEVVLAEVAARVHLTHNAAPVEQAIDGQPAFMEGLPPLGSRLLAALIPALLLGGLLLLLRRLFF